MGSDELSSAFSSSNEVAKTSSETDSSSEDHDQPTNLVESHSAQKKPDPTEAQAESDADYDSDPDSDDDERNAQRILKSKSQSPSSPAKSVKNRPSDEVHETSSKADFSSEDPDHPTKLVESPSTQKKPAPTEAQAQSDADSDPDSDDDERNAERIVKSKSHSPSSAKSVKKRPNEDYLRDTASKMAKKSEIPAASKDEFKNPFQRVWSDDDGIAILTGLAEYAEKTGDATPKDMDGFHNFIKKSIRVKASNKQLAEKIRNFKKKYVQNCEREKTGKGLRLLSAYSKTIFELSKKIWANEEANRITDITTSNMKVNLKEASDPNASVNEIIRFIKSLGLLVLDDDAIKRRYELIGASKKEEVVDTWKEIQNAECELFARRMMFVKDFSSLILDGTISSGT